MKKWMAIGSMALLIANFSHAAGDHKTTMRKAYQTEFKVAGASAAAAAVAYSTGHERIADMFSQQAVSNTIAGYQNYENYKSFEPDYDKSKGLDFNNVAHSVGLNNLPGFKDGKLNRTPASNKEDLEKDMSAFMDDLKGLDASSPALANLSKEDLERFLKEGTMPEMPEINVDAEKSQGGLSTNLNFMAYGGGDSSRSDPDYTSMFQSLFGSNEKINSDYVGNIPARYLAQEDDSETIWDRISKTTRKHLKQ